MTTMEMGEKWKGTGTALESKVTTRVSIDGNKRGEVQGSRKSRTKEKRTPLLRQKQ